MGGVDIANQPRANDETHQKEWRSWFPLFHWCLDIAVIKAFHITNILRENELGMAKVRQTDFRVHLYEQLFEQGNERALGLKQKAAEATVPDPCVEHQVVRAPSKRQCY